MPLEVSVSDLVRLELTTEEEAIFSIKDLAQRLFADGWIQHYDAKKQIFTLTQQPDESCIFLDKSRKCKVYDKRPLVCRSFPTEVGKRKGFCPYSKTRN